MNKTLALLAVLGVFASAQAFADDTATGTVAPATGTTATGTTATGTAPVGTTGTTAPATGN